MLLFERVLAEVRLVMGDQADPFITRQCRVHLAKPKESLTTADLPKLAWWVKVSASLVISKEKAEKLSERILALAE